MVTLADGSDLGGSIRIPAACCGVVGLKPSRGRVSIGPDFGDVGGGLPCDGVFTRSVRDTAVALDAMAGYEPGDRYSTTAPARTFAQWANADPGRLAIAVTTGAPLGVPVDDEPRRAVEATADMLAQLGHDVRSRRPTGTTSASPRVGRRS